MNVHQTCSNEPMHNELSAMLNTLLVGCTWQIKSDEWTINLSIDPCDRLDDCTSDYFLNVILGKLLNLNLGENPAYIKQDAHIVTGFAHAENEIGINC